MFRFPVLAHLYFSSHVLFWPSSRGIPIGHSTGFCQRRYRFYGFIPSSRPVSDEGVIIFGRWNPVNFWERPNDSSGFLSWCASSSLTYTYYLSSEKFPPTVPHPHLPPSSVDVPFLCFSTPGCRVFSTVRKLLLVLHADAESVRQSVRHEEAYTQA